MITAAEIICSGQIASIHAKLKTLVDGIDAIRPILVTNPLHFASSTLLDSMFICHSLAPDKR
jgi:hypothetical protein